MPKANGSRLVASAALADSGRLWSANVSAKKKGDALKDKAGRSHRHLAVAGLALLFLVACNKHKPSYGSAKTLRRAAQEQSLDHGALGGIKIYIDTSGSMRGFALGTTTYRADDTDQYRSILIALDSISSAVDVGAGSREKKQSTPVGSLPQTLTSPPDTPEVEQPVGLARFGASVEPIPPGVALIDIGVGRGDLPPIGGRSPSTTWTSTDCRPSRWGGSPATRAKIDSFYSEQITCLDLVFDEMLADDSHEKAFVLMTDAEQDAPEDSTACPSAKNPGNVQTRLYEWVHKRGNFAAVVAFKLRSFPWRAEAVGDRYCGCASRNLYIYLLTPSAEVAEQIFAHISTFWKGPPEAIAYLPLSPRSASEFRVRMSLPKSKSGPSPAIVHSEDSKEAREPATPGTLPLFQIKLSDEYDQAAVTFRITAAGFESAATRSRRGFYPVDWSKAQYAWGEQPIRLSLASDTGKASNATSGRAGGGGSGHEDDEREGPEANLPKLVAVRDTGGLSFTRPATEDNPSVESSISRTGHYHARPTLLAKEQMTADLSSVTYVVRRNSGQAHGCEVYLLELKATSLDLLDLISRQVPLVRDAQPPCSGIDSVRNQVQHVYRPSPVVRFLLHVDY